MKIVGECRDAAAAWKLISDEGDPVKSGHLDLQVTATAPCQQVDALQKFDAVRAWKPLPRGE